MTMLLLPLLLLLLLHMPLAHQYLLLLNLLLTCSHRLTTTVLTRLIGTAPFPLDRPWLATLVAWIVASDMAVLDETATNMATDEVDNLELFRRRYKTLRSTSSEGIRNSLGTWWRIQMTVVC
jgi:hypothetical protein